MSDWNISRDLLQIVLTVLKLRIKVTISFSKMLWNEIISITCIIVRFLSCYYSQTVSCLLHLKCLIASKVITAEKAKVLLDKPLKKRNISLESVLGGLKKMSSIKHNAAHIPQDNSPNNRSGTFSHTSITQNLKAKSLKSPTPIMPGGHKRAAENETNGTCTTYRITLQSFYFILFFLQFLYFLLFQIHRQLNDNNKCQHRLHLEERVMVVQNVEKSFTVKVKYFSN